MPSREVLEKLKKHHAEVLIRFDESNQYYIFIVKFTRDDFEYMFYASEEQTKKYTFDLNNLLNVCIDLAIEELEEKKNDKRNGLC